MRGVSEEVIKMTRLFVDLQAGTRPPRFLTHFPVLGMYIPPIIPIARVVSRMLLERTMCCCHVDGYVAEPC